MMDRSELEKEYYTGLHKIAKKAKKAATKCVGTTLVTAWQRLTDFLEKEEEVHRELSGTLAQDCARPIKIFTDQQVKQREPVEAAVEKQSKAHSEKQKLQLKLKKAAHKQFKDMELGWDQLDAMKRGEGKPMADKDVQKFEKACRKMEDSLSKMDREFQDSNIRTEEARLGWETAMYRYCQTLESLENERLIQISSTLTKYSELFTAMLPPMEERCRELSTMSSGISPPDDIRDVCVAMGPGPNQPEQLLLDCYESDLQNPMNMERRKANLERKIQEMEEEIERRKKARQGLESLSKAYVETPDFCDEQGQNDVVRQLAEADAMLNMLNANLYKLLCAQAECSNFPKPTNPHAEYIQNLRDKNGSLMTVLKIPLDCVSSDNSLYALPDKSKKNSLRPGRPPPMQNATPKDDFESSDEHGAGGKGRLEFSEPPEGISHDYIAQCRVEFDYQPNQPDELLIHSGDIVNLIEKQDQDWWKGELNGNIGIFPASYVQELS
eukprot:Em0004g19a